jgi:hypothetical protein
MITSQHTFEARVLFKGRTLALQQHGRPRAVLGLDLERVRYGIFELAQSAVIALSRASILTLMLQSIDHRKADCAGPEESAIPVFRTPSVLAHRDRATMHVTTGAVAAFHLGSFFGLSASPSVPADVKLGVTAEEIARLFLFSFRPYTPPWWPLPRFAFPEGARACLVAKTVMGFAVTAPSPIGSEELQMGCPERQATLNIPRSTSTAQGEAARKMFAEPRLLQEYLERFLLNILRDGNEEAPIVSAVMQLVQKHLAVASQRKRVDLQSDKFSLGMGSFEVAFMTDEQLLNTPQAIFAEWVTSVAVREPGLLSFVALERLWKSWALCLRSASTRLKEKTLRKLTALGELTIMQRFPASSLASAVPRDRLQQLCAKRIDREMEESPRHSRYTQALIEFVAVLRMMEQPTSLTLGQAHCRGFLRLLNQSRPADVGASSPVSPTGPSSHVFGEPPLTPLAMEPSCLSLGLSDGRVEDIALSWTVEMWLRVWQAPTKSAIVMAGNSSALILMSAEDGKCCLALTTGSYQDLHKHLASPKGKQSMTKGLQITSFESVALTVGHWSHVAFVSASKGGVSLFVDGQYIETGSSTGVSAPLGYIGSRIAGLGACVDLSHLRIWHASRTGGEIARDMNARLLSDTSRLHFPDALTLAFSFEPPSSAISGEPVRMAYMTDARERYTRSWGRNVAWITEEHAGDLPHLSETYDDLADIFGDHRVVDAGVESGATGAGELSFSQVASPERLIGEHHENMIPEKFEFAGAFSRNPVLYRPLEFDATGSGNKWGRVTKQSFHVSWICKPLAEIADRERVHAELVDLLHSHASFSKFVFRGDDEQHTALEGSKTQLDEKDLRLVTKVREGAVLPVFGTMTLPESRVACSIIGWLDDVPQDDDESPLACEVLFFIRGIIEGPPDALEWLLGSRFKGKMNGEQFSGDWSTHLEARALLGQEAEKDNDFVATLVSKELSVTDSGRLIVSGERWGSAIVLAKIPACIRGRVRADRKVARTGSMASPAASGSRSVGGVGSSNRASGSGSSTSARPPRGLAEILGSAGGPFSIGAEDLAHALASSLMGAPGRGGASDGSSTATRAQRLEGLLANAVAQADTEGGEEEDEGALGIQLLTELLRAAESGTGSADGAGGGAHRVVIPAIATLPGLDELIASGQVDVEVVDSLRACGMTDRQIREQVMAMEGMMPSASPASLPTAVAVPAAVTEGPPAPPGAAEPDSETRDDDGDDATAAVLRAIIEAAASESRRSSMEGGSHRSEHSSDDGDRSENESPPHNASSDSLPQAGAGDASPEAGDGLCDITEDASAAHGHSPKYFLRIPSSMAARVATSSVAGEGGYDAVESSSSLRSGLTDWSSLGNALPKDVADHVGDMNMGELGIGLISSGKVYFEVKIDNTVNRFVGVGIAAYGSNVDDYLGGPDGRSFAVQGTKETWHGGTNRPYGESFVSGDIIGVEVDMDSNTMECFRNSRSLGIAFTEIDKALRESSRTRRSRGGTSGGESSSKPSLGFAPGICCYGDRNQVRLIGYRTGIHSRMYHAEHARGWFRNIGQWRHGVQHGSGLLFFRTGKEPKLKVESTLPVSNEARSTVARTEPALSATMVRKLKTLAASPLGIFADMQVTSDPFEADESHQYDSCNVSGFLVGHWSQGYLQGICRWTTMPQPTSCSQALSELPSDVESLLTGTPVLSEGERSNSSIDPAIVAKAAFLGCPASALKSIASINSYAADGLDVLPRDLLRHTYIEAKNDELLRILSEDEVIAHLQNEFAALLELSIGALDAETASAGTAPLAGEEALSSSGNGERLRPREQHAVLEVGGWFELDRDRLFVFCPSLCAKNVNVSRDLRTIHGKETGMGVVYGSKAFTRGVHFWELDINKLEQRIGGRQVEAAMFIGVAELPTSFHPVLPGGPILDAAHEVSESATSSRHPPRLYDAGSSHSGSQFSQWKGAGYANNFTLNMNGSEVRIYGNFYSSESKTKIGVCLNMDDGTLSFARDADEFGEQIVEIFDPGYRYMRSTAGTGGPLAYPRILYPVVGIRYPGDGVTLEGAKWVSSDGVSPTTSLSNMVHATDLLHSFVSEDVRTRCATAMSDPIFLERVYRQQYLPRCQRLTIQTPLNHKPDALKALFSATAIVMHPTRATSLRIPIDRSGLACARALVKSGAPRNAVDIRGGDRIRSTEGECLVLGAYRNRIWYLVEADTERGAWYWSGEELDTALNQEFMWGLLPRNETTKQEADIEKEFLETADKTQDEPCSDEIIPGESCPYSFDEFCEVVDNARWTPPMDEALVHFANAQCDKVGCEPEQCYIERLPEADSLRLPDEASLRARYSVLLAFNEELLHLLPLVDLTLRRPRGAVTTDEAAISFVSHLGELVAKGRGLILTRTKLRYWKRVLNETVDYTRPSDDPFDKPRGIPEINIERMAAREENLLKLSTHAERIRASVFGQLMQHASTWSDGQFRKAFAKRSELFQKRSFYVKLTGEGVGDEGGPYRLILATACAEEPSGPLQLFVPSPNVERGGESSRDKLVFNPRLDLVDSAAADRSLLSSAGGSSTAASKVMSEYRFLGIIVGMAVRHGIQLPLNLPAVVWKPLVGQPIGLADLKEVDEVAASALESLFEVPVPFNLIDENALAELRLVAQTAVAALGDFAPANAMPAADLVDFSTRDDFARYLVSAAVRRGQSATHLQAFLWGLSVSLPVELFALFTPRELENLFCGPATVDVGMLRKATQYGLGAAADAAHISYFWNVMESLEQEDLIRFLGFVAGRSRMPSSIDGFRPPLTIEGPAGGKAAEKPDDYFPRGQTCFVKLVLPAYSSEEILRNKLVTAIREAKTLDSDFQARVGIHL